MVMKTFTILVAGLAAGLTVPAAACDPQVRAMAEEAHDLAAELAALTQPYAPYNAVWACAARNAVRADLAAEEVLCALDRGDYCAARDAAEQLHAFAEDIEDDVEDLEIRPGRWRSQHRYTHGGVGSLADRLEDVSGDLYRAVRRLDEAYDGPASGGGLYYDSPGPSGPSAPYVVPENTTPAPGTIYEDSWPRRSPGGFNGSYDGSLGPSFGTPPAGSHNSAPTIYQGSGGPLLPNSYHSGYSPSARRSLPPGQAKKVDWRRTSAQLLIQAIAD
jgi:hypothetical protein